MNHPPPPHYANAPKKRSGNGCVIALAILGVFVLGAVALGVGGVYLFATSKGGKEILQVVGQGAKAVGEAAKVMEKAGRAPGTSEVRALGCEQAFVIDMDELLNAMDQFDAGLAGKGPAPVPIMVACQVGPFDKAPDCDDVAQAYLRGAGRPRGEFAVTVGSEHDKKQRCGGRYAPDGTRLGNFSGSMPVVPAPGP